MFGLKPKAALLISLPKLAATITQRLYQNVKADYAYQPIFVRHNAQLYHLYEINRLYLEYTVTKYD